MREVEAEDDGCQGPRCVRYNDAGRPPPRVSNTFSAQKSRKKECVAAPVKFRIVRNLRVLSPNNFAASSDETKFLQKARSAGGSREGGDEHTETLTSITVPLVMTPSCVYCRGSECKREKGAPKDGSGLTIGDCGFFLTPMMGSWNVAFNSAAREDVSQTQRARN